MAYSVLLEDEAIEMLEELDNSIRVHILKKLKRMEEKDSARHLEHGVPYFVEEVGQYRIAFILRKDQMQKRVVFVGDHKQYEKWCLSQT